MPWFRPGHLLHVVQAPGSMTGLMHSSMTCAFKKSMDEATLTLVTQIRACGHARMSVPDGRVSTPPRPHNARSPSWRLGRGPCLNLQTCCAMWHHRPLSIAANQYGAMESVTGAKGAGTLIQAQGERTRICGYVQARRKLRDATGMSEPG